MRFVRDHRSGGDLRRVRKRGLEPLRTHPGRGDARRLVSLFRVLEQTDRGEDAVTGVDEVVAREAGQLAQRRQQAVADLPRYFFGAHLVDAS